MKEISKLGCYASVLTATPCLTGRELKSKALLFEVQPSPIPRSQVA